MTKQELKSFIQSLSVDQEFMQLLLAIVENVQEITPQFLSGLAKILESYAEYSNNVANCLDQIAQETEKIALQFEELDNKETEERLRILESIQKQALFAINSKLEGLKDK